MNTTLHTPLHLAVAATSLTLLTLAGAASAAPASDPLAEHRWRSRLLVVLAPSDRDPRALDQRRIFRDAAAKGRERDLVLVERTGSSAEADALRRRFGVAASEFRAVLVGKDGGDKLASSEPIEAERLFAEIDRMPMRRDEVRARTR